MCVKHIRAGHIYILYTSQMHIYIYTCCLRSPYNIMHVFLKKNIYTNICIYHVHIHIYKYIYIVHMCIHISFKYFISHI